MLLLAGCLASFAVVATMIFNWVLSVSLILLLAERERIRGELVKSFKLIAPLVGALQGHAGTGIGSLLGHDKIVSDLEPLS